MGPSIPLSFTDIALASGFVLLAGVVSLFLRLGMERTLLWAALRTLIQLGIAGLTLGFVFRLNSWYLVCGLALIMALMAGREAIRRQKNKLPGIWWDTMITITLTSFLVAVLVTGVVVGADPWWRPSVFIPIIGMILGNSLNGISISLERFLNSCKTQKSQIEARLLLGANPREASLPYAREAVRAGMIPIINAMMIVGIVSLPGMMTGQLLAGADPKDAVLYQIVVMYMLAAASSLGSMFIILLARRRLFRHGGTFQAKCAVN